MSFEFFEIEDNFCPNYASDPYRRVHIRTRVNVKEGQTMKDAQEAAETFIKEYIYDHTVSTPPSTYTYPIEPIPDRQVEKGETRSLVEQICFAETMADLKQFELLAKMNPSLQTAYDNTYRLILQNEK